MHLASATTSAGMPPPNTRPQSRGSGCRSAAAAEVTGGNLNLLSPERARLKAPRLPSFDGQKLFVRTSGRTSARSSRSGSGFLQPCPHSNPRMSFRVTSTARAEGRWRRSRGHRAPDHKQACCRGGCGGAPCATQRWEHARGRTRRSRSSSNVPNPTDPDASTSRLSGRSDAHPHRSVRAPGSVSSNKDLRRVRASSGVEAALRPVGPRRCATAPARSTPTQPKGAPSTAPPPDDLAMRRAIKAVFHLIESALDEEMVMRDRDGTFEPMIVRKRQRRRTLPVGCPSRR